MQLSNRVNITSPSKRGSVRTGVLLMFVSLIISLYFFELLLAVGVQKLFLPKDFDSRSRAQVVDEFREKGVVSYPVVSPWLFFQNPIFLAKERVFPISGIANVQTVFCNELGQYYNYQSDRYGFNNPDSTWDRESLDILLVGDSFTHGMCVPDGGTFAERLRKKNSSLLNLGFNGNGPLIKLASLREYGQAFKPKVTLWFFFEGNDQEDLAKELNEPLLASYLSDPNYSQNLKARTSEIDQAIRKLADHNLELESPRGFLQRVVSLKHKLNQNFPAFVKLYSVRNLLGISETSRLWPHKALDSHETEKLNNALREIFVQATELTASWGGELVIVYLPAQTGIELNQEHPWRKDVLSLVNALNLPLIDILPIFKKSIDPLQFFPNRKDGHYSALGNAIVAKSVFPRLRKH